MRPKAAKYKQRFFLKTLLYRAVDTVLALECRTQIREQDSDLGA